MPPVLGPSSPSKMRLKSWAGVRATASVPSQITNSETSGPSRNCSITTVEPASRQASAWAAAAWRSSVTTTPLPAARPSSLTTCGAPNASRASWTCCSVVQVRAWAVGTPALSMTSLAKALEPSSRAASADGPNTSMPSARRASATPATSGASGPTTTRSAPIVRVRARTAAGSWGSTGWTGTSREIPALPGAACTSLTAGSRRRVRTMACSRPPEPMTRIFTGPA